MNKSLKKESLQKINYQTELERLIEKNAAEGIIPSLLLHSCCAPCSSYVLEYLSRYFQITVFYYNPNIYPEEEFYKRCREQERFISMLPAQNPISFIGSEHMSERFYEAVKGLEHIKEGGERCFACYRLRLAETAETAHRLGMDYFTTTLSISPMKNAAMLNEIGGQEAERCGVKYLFSDFKKKGGYLRSSELSRQYGIYRQNYCGCVFSKKETEERRAERMNRINIKKAEITDFKEISEIMCNDLGYACDAELVKRKLSMLDGNREAVFVAEVNGSISGVVHVEKYDVLYFDTMANILGLAVKKELRRMGIGRRLMQSAEDWAEKIGASAVRLNSGAARNEAHIFYRSIGYSSEKDQKRFIKQIKKDD